MQCIFFRHPNHFLLECGGGGFIHHLVAICSEDSFHFVGGRQQIPVIFLQERQHAAAKDETSQRQASIDGGKEAAAVLGFSGAIGAYGGFFIPKGFGTSISMTGSPNAALIAFIIFYFSCLVVTWWWYSRRNAPMPC